MFNYPVKRDSFKKYPLESWKKEFDSRWSLLSSSYFQYERLQNYQELSNPSYNSYISGDIDLARSKLEEYIKLELPYYREITQKGVPYTRVHTIQRPLSDYLKWEFELYSILATCGERILLLDLNTISEQNILESFDFLLFDENIVMIQDYGNEGILSGGWIVTDTAVVQQFVNFSKQLTQLSVPFADYNLQYLSK